jgi:DNA end-binding protein Ku
MLSSKVHIITRNKIGLKREKGGTLAGKAPSFNERWFGVSLPMCKRWGITMGRAMWSGNITFGLVSIPVKLHTATSSGIVSLHQLHDRCDTRIKELRWCPHCKQEVEWKHVVKGYEYAKNKYLEVTAEDWDKLPLPSKQTIEVASFVDADTVDAIYYDTPYFIELGKQALKPYRLLLNTLKEKNKVGIAKVTFRTRERLCALRPMGNELILQTLYYADEIKPVDEYEETGSVSVSAQEKKMANALVDALSSKFEPEKFHDTYEDALKKLIKAKLKGVDIEAAGEAAADAHGLDLMEALRASVENLSNAHRQSDTNETATDRKRKTRAVAHGKSKSKPAGSKQRTGTHNRKIA